MQTARYYYSSILCVSFLIFSEGSALAERYRYMDSAGNIRWADTIYQIPMQYRDQVQHATPIPDERTYKWMLQQQKKKEAEKKKQEAEEERKRLAEERRLEAEKRKKELEEKRKALREKKNQKKEE